MTNSITPLQAFDDNYIWCISNAQQKKALVIDPGDSQVVLNYLASHAYQLCAILVTHHHYDHTDGINGLLQRYPDTPVYGNGDSPCSAISQPLDDGDHITIMGQEFQLLTVPGHTLDHVAYYDAKNQQLFCGDTLFLAGCGRIFEGTAAQMHQSLQKLMALPSAVQAYPAHEYSLANLAFAAAVEPDNKDITQTIKQAQQKRQQGEPSVPSSLSQEALVNPFVRCHIPAVIVAANQKAERQLASQTDVFATLREWKNNF
ncbi:MAG: hydroxyacylglutathione hydrolase [Gammaproteobacteria bacterium]|jgi:hydroxyacylglutathione hydrolase|nr:hydroxyacylglutathione hydrolase [Gammaproteobacteria bacterium]